jgi:hypothetical protein
MGAWLQGREAAKRRDDRYLFSALTNPEILGDWLRFIGAQDLPLAAVYLLPMVSVCLLETLQVKAANLLLAAQHSGGLRLTFFRDRQFRLSRLTRGDGAKGVDPVKLFAGEISNTRLYLHALRTATLDEHLTVLLLDRNDELEHVAAAITHENPSLDCVRASRAEIASRLGMEQQLLASTPDALYLQLLGLKPPAGNIAPATATVGYRRYRARRAIYAGCAGLAATAMLWSAVNGWRAYGISSQAADIAQEISRQETQYQQITRAFPPAPTNGENLRRAVELAKAIRENTRDPVPVMTLISQALQNSPEIFLRDFGWRYGTAAIQKGGEIIAAAEPSAKTAAAVSAPPRVQSAYLSGEIRPFRGDYRAAIASINTLAARLRANPLVADVRTTKMPLNVSPTAVLSGNTLESRGEAATAEFEIVIVLKPKV